MSLPLDDIVNIIVNLPSVVTAGRQFDLPLLIGNTAAFNDRVKIYSSTDELLEDGFLTSDRIYKAAVLLFGQEEKPGRIAVGKIGTVTEPNTAGTGEILLADAIELNPAATVGEYIYEGYALSDTAEAGYLLIIADGTTPQTGEINLTDAQAMNADAQVGQYIAEAQSWLLSASQVAGSELIVADTITRSETITEYLTACRQANDEWYCVNVCSSLTDSEIVEGAQYCETCSPSAVFCFTTAEADALTANPNVFATLKTLGLRRCFGQYSTTHADAVCAIVGWAMGVITKNVSFTLAYKPEVGVAVEDAITKTGYNYLVGNYGNVYDSRGGYNVFEQGRMADGSYFDEIIQLDKYQLKMQKTVMDLLTTRPKIAQTEDGLAVIISAINKVCNEMFSANFIAGGVWNGRKVLNLEPGDAIPNGYLVQAESVDSQSQADRDARKAPPIYVSLKLAGAFHFVTIYIDVNR